MRTAILTALLAAALWTYGEEPKPSYPLATCVVSGEELGEHGEPFVYKYKGHEVRFCCKDCIGDFEKDPEKYLKMIEQAKKKAGDQKTIDLKHEGHDHGKAGAE
jgi:YHS domain-containing protein